MTALGIAPGAAPRPVSPRPRTLALLGAGILLVSSVGFAQCTKSVSWRDDPPFLTHESDGSVHGIHADLIRESLKRMGCSVRFVEMPLARSLVELQAGRVDIVSGLADTPERKEYAWFSRPINYARNVLFIQRSAAARFRIEHLADIMGTDFRLGAVNKALYGGDYDLLLAKPAFRDRLTFLTSRAGSWKMMAASRLDGVIDNELTGLNEIRGNAYSGQIVETKIVMSEEPDLVAFSHKTTSVEFVSQFDLAFDGILADGSFKSIFSQYARCEVSTRKLGCK